MLYNPLPIRTLRRERVSAIVQAELRNIQRVAELRQKPACLQVRRPPMRVSRPSKPFCLWRELF